MLGKTKRAFTTLIIFTCLISGCEYYNHDLSIQNLSKKDITILYSNTSVPHTENNVEFYIADRNIIPPDSMHIHVIPGRSDAWRSLIEDGAERGYLFTFFS